MSARRSCIWRQSKSDREAIRSRILGQVSRIACWRGNVHTHDFKEVGGIPSWSSDRGRLRHCFIPSLRHTNRISAVCYSPLNAFSIGDNASESIRLWNCTGLVEGATTHFRDDFSVDDKCTSAESGIVPTTGTRSLWENFWRLGEGRSLFSKCAFLSSIMASPRHCEGRGPARGPQEAEKAPEKQLASPPHYALRHGNPSIHQLVTYRDWKYNQR